MNSLPRLLLAALLLAASAAGRAQSIAELPDDKFKLLVDKTMIYSKALTAARVVQKSYDRYATWVDMKTGPTGKEKNADGIATTKPPSKELSRAATNGQALRAAGSVKKPKDRNARGVKIKKEPTGKKKTSMALPTSQPRARKYRRRRQTGLECGRRCRE